MAKKDKGPGTGGGGGAACGLRIFFLWLVVLFASFFGYSSGTLSVCLSLLATLAEIALFAARHQNKAGKRRHSLRPAGFFPLQLLGIYMIQLWLMMFYYASEDGGPSQVNPQHGGSTAELALGMDHPNFAKKTGSAPAPADPGSNSEGPSGEAAPSSQDDVPAREEEVQSASNSDSSNSGQSFVLDAPPELLRWSPKTISVILPCAEEREYAYKTVVSVFESTPNNVLHEIVVVDDGSNPPLSETHLTPEVQAKYKVKIERHDSTVGLIGAKKTGGDAATGDILVFFDCHVAPQANWYKDFLKLSAENYRRMVVPHITSLNVDTWKQIGSGGGLAKCYLTWDADFKWVDGKDPYIPVISGGLLGMSRRWWEETGGYDKEMLGWGGENLDQSLRVWLCGGEIMMAPNSQVAHMWRDGTKKTNARYKHVGDTQRNRARAIFAWYGDFGDKVMDYPAFAHRGNPKSPNPWFGDLSTFDEVKQRLGGCRPFAWFLERFHDIYVDGGLIPPEIFMLKEESSGLCLHFKGQAGTSGRGRDVATMDHCQENDHRFFWHLGNSNKEGTCCSGLRAWNTDQCINGASKDQVTTGVCAVSGVDRNQFWELTNSGLLQRGKSCLIASSRGGLSEGSCSLRGGDGMRWTKVAARKPKETELFEQALEQHPEYRQNKPSSKPSQKGGAWW